ncbi:group II intron reverse transcriptase/maturase (plasmid) [Escherichia coli]|nr:group II intron reverse transcriptase/maturase [Escherichia coli]
MPAFEGFMCAPSAKGDDKFITTDYLQQCHIFYAIRDTFRGEVLEISDIKSPVGP